MSFSKKNVLRGIHLQMKNTQGKYISVVKGKIAGFKIPKPEDMFFQNEILPRGATGKILKREVRNQINDMLEKAKQGRM